MSEPPVSRPGYGREPLDEPETAAIGPVSELSFDDYHWVDAQEAINELRAELAAEKAADAKRRSDAKPPVSGSRDGREPLDEPEPAAITPVSNPATGRQAIRGHANAAKYLRCNEMAVRRARKRLNPDCIGKVWFYDREALDALKAELEAEKEAETADDALAAKLDALFLEHANRLSVEDYAEKAECDVRMVRAEYARFTDEPLYNAGGGGALVDWPALLTRKQLIELSGKAAREREREDTRLWNEQRAQFEREDREREARQAKQKAEFERQEDRRTRDREKRQAAHDLRLAQLRRQLATVAPPEPDLAETLLGLIKAWKGVK